MIEITRSLARQLKTAFHRAITVSGRGTVNQPVLLHAGSDGLRVRIASHEVAAEYHDPSPREPDAAYSPFELLKDCEGKTDDPVQVEMAASDQLLATWNDHHVPQMKQYDIPPREDLFPDWPDAFTDNPPELAGALHAAMETASPESARYSLNCVQLQGVGTIVATDGRQMLLQSGFEFPWDEDLLIPRRSVFGSNELPRGTKIHVGRSDGWVWFRMGCWSFAFAINEEGRFPPDESNIPNAEHAAASIQIDSHDADFLVKSMKQLPGNSDRNSPVTVDANGCVAVRSKSEDARRSPRPPPRTQRTTRQGRSHRRRVAISNGQLTQAKSKTVTPRTNKIVGRLIRHIQDAHCHNHRALRTRTIAESTRLDSITTDNLNNCDENDRREAFQKTAVTAQPSGRNS